MLISRSSTRGQRHLRRQHQRDHHSRLDGATVNGNGGSDTLLGQGADDILNGGSGIDTLSGRAGNDTLNGDTGADQMSGGVGNDTYVVDDPGDAVLEVLFGGGTDTVQSSINYTLGVLVENLTLTGSADINGTGTFVANTMLGNSGANVLSGLDGSDMLDGGAGADTLIGGTVTTPTWSTMPATWSWKARAGEPTRFRARCPSPSGPRSRPSPSRVRRPSTAPATPEAT
jgi:hypothetical protein